MGAVAFETMWHGKTPEAAFSGAVQFALWESGHGGYTGTIAEKPGFVVFDLPPRVMADKVLAMVLAAALPEAVAEMVTVGWSREDIRRAQRAWGWLVERFSVREARALIEVHHDKWGPAVALPVSGKALAAYKLRQPLRRGERVWLFAGYASY